MSEEEGNTSTISNTNSAIYEDKNKYEDDGLANSGSDAIAPAELPRQPASAYVTVWILCLLIAFGGFLYGWDTGTIGGFMKYPDFLRRFGLRHKDGTYYMSNVRTGLIVAFFNIGAAIGGIVWSRLGNIYGRKLSLALVTVVYTIGLVIQIASISKWYQYFVGRIISGCGIGGIGVYSSMLIGETAPKHVRGTLVSCYQLMITLGIFLGNCTELGTKNYSNSVQWRVPLGLGFAWSLFMICGLSFVPESPRFLIEVGKIEEARESIAKSNKLSPDDPGVIGETELMAASIESERAVGNATWRELWSPKGKILHRTIFGLMIQSLEQLTGINYFFYYGTQIFVAIGLKDSFETAIVISVINFAATGVGIFFIDRFGRRACLLWGALGMIACLVVYASVGVRRLFPNGRDRPASKGAGDCMICFTCFYIVCFATTWAPAGYVIIAETFPLRIKPKAMALAMTAKWIWAFLIAFFTPFISSAIHFSYGYVFMGCVCFAWCYVFLMVPETKGLSLEEVNVMWEEGVLPWKSTAWVPPSKRNDDYDADAMAHDDVPVYKRMLGRK
ncbi:sugar porter family MFS transporter KNAG_0M02690 [Huiozyma naganishii CBS 8797]|uniref:Major facilitator superfamily (MFS) profile domain-containing protein n=1 Tax=Huiozyma naganishii (strain ATCC MYA-139 / BCRC 22969 / CBS 8797 / KCTC 17520 / NBRC 10181 / NCYC 3082 / Yp74L-3) TaxID=1071383 RepID=J7S4B9_HUIN7|nr:hypothetical protein KNAG_0M02690 [Kazachstania naganishii CBS 8797]CCK73122.1 hypothetical protein KNAG_0M02690 [Kazachstania naganishii CBS 8797]